jgi:hypothetical protein
MGLKLNGTHQLLTYADHVNLLGDNTDTIKKYKENLRVIGLEIKKKILIQEGIKKKLNSGKACCHSVQNLLSSHLLLKNVNIRIYKTIILLVVLYGCETWSLTLREEHRLTVFENKVLRRTFGPKRDVVMGGWRKLHNEELYDLYSSQNIIRMIKSKGMRWAGHAA